MRRFTFLAAASVAGAALIGTAAEGDRKSRGEYRPLGSDATFTTVHTDALGLEGLTADNRGNLYSPARGAGAACPIRRVPASGGTAVTVGSIPAPCGPAGLAFDRHGDLFVADGGEGKIHRLRPSASNPPTSTVFAAGVPGANGVAFDKRGDLWVSDGTTAQGRVWRIRGDRDPEEVFRVQPMVNDVVISRPAAVPPVDISGIGRDPRSAPLATVTITPDGRQAANMLGSQHLVANGLAFDRDGSLFVGDTARGAIWRVELDRRGNLRSPTGCDTTFEPNTLCLDNVFVQHPSLEGVDGIALDREGNVIGASNERNAIVVATARDGVVEVFRNPVAAERLRNDGPLEFPTSPVIVGRKLCLTHSDGSRRDNYPSTGGAVGPNRTPPALAKVSCLDRRLPAEGLPLPVR